MALRCATTRLKTAVWKQGKTSTNQWRANSQNRCKTRGKDRNLGAPILRGSSAQNHNLPLAEMTSLASYYQYRKIFTSLTASGLVHYLQIIKIWSSLSIMQKQKVRKQ